MQLNLSNVEVDLEQIVDSAIGFIPGNPAFAAPLEKEAIHWLLTYGFAFIQAKVNSPATTPALADAAAKGTAAGLAAAQAVIKP